MSLDVTLTASRVVSVYEANITHNLNKMAEAAGVYHHLWRPEEIGITRARDLIKPLLDGLEKLEADPEKFKKLNADNGWGKYENLVEFIRKYLAACMADPDAEVKAER